MARQSHKLTTRAVAAVKLHGLYSDGGGLYLQIARGGSKSWVYRFMLRRRSRDMGLGGIDVVSLSVGRERALEARKPVKAGEDRPRRQKERPAGAAGGRRSVKEDVSGLRGEVHHQP